MDRASEQQIIGRIKNKETFTAQIDTGAFAVRIGEYAPSICTAIHDGHRIHEAFAGKMLITEKERKYEEDPFTGDIIKEQPVSIVVLDSRYNYDLNRQPALCIYDEAWGKKVWRQELTKEERAHILQMHSLYYRVLDTLAGTLEEMFNGCVLYDLHSYNYSRISGDPPLFNLGTHFIDLERFEPVVDHFQQQLANIRVQGVKNRAVRDEVFSGKGYQAQFIREKHPDTLCVPVEVKKVFMAEESAELYSEIFAPLAGGIGSAIRENTSFFKATVLGNKK